MSEAQVAVRLFKAGSLELADPDPKLSPEAVKKMFAVNYPHLASSTVSGPTLEGDRVIYTFEPMPVKTKG